MSLDTFKHASFLSPLSNLSSKLWIPEEFGKIYGEHMGEEVLLIFTDDKYGKCWNVRIIKAIDGRFCFANGWPEFVKDNQLSPQESCVFTLLDDSTFRVTVFGINGVIKKPPFSLPCRNPGEAQQHRRMKPSYPSSTPRQGPQHVVEKEPVELRAAEVEHRHKKPRRPSSTPRQGPQHAVEKEPVELRAAPRRPSSTPRGRGEADLPYDSVSLSAISPFSVKVESQLFLELPVRIPPATRRKGNRLGEEHVMYLRGLNGRLIPVLYPALFEVQKLAGNWNLFCERNGLKPGDECRFDVEDENRCIYRVEKIRSNEW